MFKLTQKEIKKIRHLRNMFPRKIGVRVSRSQDGGFVAEVTTFPGCFTEADTFSELIEMVNDVVRMVLEIPKKYASFMPEYLASLKMAQRFDIFPLRRIEDNLKLLICESPSR